MIRVMAARLLTNHTRALLCIAQQPGIRLRDIATCLDMAERATHRIVCELEEAGYLTRHRIGRRNYYELHPEQPLHDPTLGDVPVGDLLAPLLNAQRPAA